MDHIADYGLTCPGAKELGHDAHAIASMEELAVDHVLPIAAGGSDHPSNLRVLCREWNTKRRG